jgi:hypothetical protein
MSWVLEHPLQDALIEVGLVAEGWDDPSEFSRAASEVLRDFAEQFSATRCANRSWRRGKVGRTDNF